MFDKFNETCYLMNSDHVSGLVTCAHTSYEIIDIEVGSVHSSYLPGRQEESRELIHASGKQSNESIIRFLPHFAFEGKLVLLGIPLNSL